MSTHILTGGDVPSSCASISSDHSEIPSYPQSDTHASPSDEPIALPHQDHLPPPSALEPKRSVSTPAPSASPSTELPRPSAVSAAVPRRTSPKKAGPSRIDRDFEALLASDKTYVLKETSRVLSPEDNPDDSSAASNRIIVERQSGQPTAFAQGQNLDDVDEEFADITPRPPDVHAFQSPQRKPQPTDSSGALLKSASGAVKASARPTPASPDRTTSLQRKSTASPNASSPASTRKAPPMSAMPGFLLPPSNDPQATLRARPRSLSSIGLEAEINSPASNEAGFDQNNAMGTLRQRMKKTSGFLRKLRKDTNSSRRETEATRSKGSSASARAYSIGSNTSATSLGRELTVSSASLGRRESKASVLSQDGSSTAGSPSYSTRKLSSHGASIDGVAVPSIPERFVQSSASSSSHLSTTKLRRKVPEERSDGSSGLQELEVPAILGLRHPSAPATLSEFTLASKVALPQRSSSQGHERQKSLGSSDSTGAIRLAIQQLESHMDDALKDTPDEDTLRATNQRDAAKVQQQWGPSPQLPDLDIQRYKERSGSFLEDSNIVSPKIYDDVALEEPKSTRSVSTSSNTKASAGVGPDPDTVHKATAQSTDTGLGIVRGGPDPDPTSSIRIGDDRSGAVPSTTLKGQQDKEIDENVRDRSASRPKPLQPTGPYKRPKAATVSPNGADSPREHGTAWGSQRDSTDPVADRSVHRRTADSASASLTSARSFETAAESADPMTQSFNLPAQDQDKSFEATPASARERANGHRSEHHNLHHRGSSGQGQESASDLAPEQTIRLVSKGSSFDDASGATTIITAPASPEMDSSALPKMVELSQHSFLRPGRNGGLSRGHSISSASVRGGAGLLSTASVGRSTSPVSSPVSGRSSLEGVTRSSATIADSASARELAAKCWNEDTSFLKREKIAEWLGGLGPVNHAARTFYFGNFDFSGLRLDVAFRRLCDKLFLRAETQQIDRILAAFSQRYFECNPDSVFGSADVIHSVVFSILLLNTDLHIADLQERMTRQQFVRNTLSAIAESSPSAGVPDDSRSSFSVAHNDISRSTDAFPRRNSVSSYIGGLRKQNSSSTNLESSSDAAVPESSRPGTAMSVAKGKESDIQALLREIYAAVKTERILLPTPEAGSGAVSGRSQGSLSATAGPRRKMGKGSERMTALKRGSIRGIQGLIGGFGSNLPQDPTPRSSVDSWGRPSQSLSDPGGLRSPPLTPGFASTLTQTIIKESQEEDAAASVAGLSPRSPLKEIGIDEEDDDDDALALAGPPWAKEGSLTRKLYWESTGKRAKDKNWAGVFMVVSKGMLSMFKFDAGGGSSATKGKSNGATAPSAALGGGNWLSSATCLGEIPLAHSLANALPPPGYSKQRPHVFALTLPCGKMYFFQTGHEELVNEWVSTCNYWAARQSKEPLSGGVSNMEYGWNKLLSQPADDEYEEELDSFSSSGNPPDGSIYQGSSVHGHTSATSSSQQHVDTRSVRSGKSSQPASRPYANRGITSPSLSSRDLTSSSSIGKFSSRANSVSTSANAGFLSNERTFINEWRIPQLSTVASTLSEERQLARLEKQVQSIETELTLHNELRQPMLSLYSPRGQNYTKALANWERKSNYLLKELVKYQSYVEALRKSSDLKAERRAKREVEGMIEEGDEALARLGPDEG